MTNDRRIGVSDPAPSYYVVVSLGKTLNPELLPVELSSTLQGSSQLSVYEWVNEKPSLSALRHFNGAREELCKCSPFNIVVFYQKTMHLLVKRVCSKIECRCWQKKKTLKLSH